MSSEVLFQYFSQSKGVCTDSRKASDGVLFFALKGPNFNGNEYAKQALEQGASVAVIDEAEYQEDERFILVKDVLKSLQDLALFYRQRFGIPILAITGSNGKTTTKELAASVLSSQYNTHFTKGNFNNHIGLPLTLLEMPPETEIAVIEMGANHIGEIAALCEIAQPTHGLITNIGKAHLEGFGGLEGVKKGKSELYAFLADNYGVAFVNLDVPFLEDLSRKITHRVLYRSCDEPKPDTLPCEVKLVREAPTIEMAFLSRQGHLISAKSQLSGHYNYHNIMTAITIGRYFKVPDEKILKAIADYSPQNNRSELRLVGTNSFILDAYNANPTSTELALEAFGKRKAETKIAILGDMLELGDVSEEEHQKILKIAEHQKLNQIVTVGPIYKQAGLEKEVLSFESVEELKKWFISKDFQGTTFLLKGSRRIGLEKLLK